MLASLRCLSVALAFVLAACQWGGSGESPVQSVAAAVETDATFHVLAWNVNSGVGEPPEASPDEIVSLIEAHPGADIYALSEVHPDWVRPLTAAADRVNEATFDASLSESGRQQRLLLLVNADRFRPVEVNELHRVNRDGHGRSPIAALLEDRVTGEQLLVVLVHLRRGNADARRAEAVALRGLIDELAYPTLLVGDFNMDCDADTERVTGCNDAFGALAADGRAVWRPHQSREATHCERGRYNSVLDYVFAANDAVSWTVDVAAGDRRTYCSARMGDGAHLPLHARVTPL